MKYVWKKPRYPHNDRVKIHCYVTDVKEEFSYSLCGTAIGGWGMEKATKKDGPRCKLCEKQLEKRKKLLKSENVNWTICRHVIITCPLCGYSESSLYSKIPKKCKSCGAELGKRKL